jgi:hypothetical protein
MTGICDELFDHRLARSVGSSTCYGCASLKNPQHLDIFEGGRSSKRAFDYGRSVKLAVGYCRTFLGGPRSTPIQYIKSIPALLVMRL